MRFNIIQVVSIFTVFQSIFMCFYFLARRNGDRQINLLLSSILFCFAVLVTISLSLTEGLELVLIEYHKAIFLVRQIAFLVGPLLLWFVRRLLNPRYELTARSFWHLLPFMLSLLFNGIAIGPLPEFVLWLSDLRMINTVLILVHLLTYVILAIAFVRTNSFRSGPIGSRTSIMRLGSFIIGGTVLIWLVELNSLVILNVLEYFQYCPHMTGLYSASTFMCFNSIAFFALLKPHLFTLNRKYEKSRLQESEKQKYQRQLVEYMETQKPYRKSTFTISDLSKGLSVATSYLSQVINELNNQSFPDFINSYRIEESKRLLLDHSQGKRTILEIAYMAGFNSKSAFNAAFKKHAGVTPKEFRKANSSPDNQQ